MTEAKERGCLTLRRTGGESFRLYTSDGMVEIEVFRVSRGKAEFSIDAPLDIRIVRTEVDGATGRSA